MLRQDVVERGYHFRLIADESISKVVPQHLAAPRGQKRGLPGELQQLPLQLRAALHQARDRRHIASFQTLVQGHVDAIQEWSTAVCGTPIRPCFDSDMDGCAFPPMNGTDR